MQFEELVKDLATRLNTEITVEDGACTLGVDDMAVTLMALPEVEAVAFAGEIGEPPPQGLEELYRSMLAANHLFRGTAGSTISLNEQNNKFNLCWYAPEAILDGEKFFQSLERFVNTLEAWKKMLADYRPEEKPAAKSDAETAPAPGFGANGFMSV